MKHLNLLRTATALLAATALVTSCTTNWPQYRGPEQNFVVKQANLPSEWGEGENIRWATDIEGDSWSSPVVWGNKIFVTAAVPLTVNPPSDQQGQSSQGEDQSYLNDIYRWQVACYDAESGEELWKVVAREGNPRTKKHRATSYAPETPVVDGQRLYVYFGMIGMFCYDHNGQLLWEQDLGAYETLNGWGTGSSPVLHDGLLYQQVDNEENSFLVALDASSGKEAWRVNREEKTNYSTPVIWKNRERTELVTGGKRARAYDPATGEMLWELQLDGYYNIPSPVPGDEVIYLGNAGFRDTPGTLFAVKAGAEGDITPAGGETSNEYVVWSYADAPTENPTPLLYNGLIYVLSSRGGTLTCFDAETGEQVYQEKAEGMGACWASPWAHGNDLYFYDETGKTSVVRAGRQFELIHQNNLEGKFWASVAVAGDSYILKAVERLYCVGL
jgi:outer membrane protein assembly factor BamB